MIDIRGAVNAVTEYLDEIGPIFSGSDPRLEEFDYDQNRVEWTITLSFDDPYSPFRTYKTFKVDETGSVRSMRVRNPVVKESA